MNYDTTVKLILDECKNLEEILNNNLLKTFNKLHNIDDSESLLHLKQEVIAKSSFFMDVKKHYALYIINKEGKSCDEPMIKGLPTQRSEFPELTRECLFKLFELLIKEDVVNFTNIFKHLDDSRESIYEHCLSHSKKIAKSASFKRQLHEYKVVTADINGMLLWNELEYDYFQPGTKGYLFKILGIDMFEAPEHIKNKAHILTRKNTCIVVPFEEDKLPDYYILNVEGQMDYAWDKRASNIMRVLQGDADEELTKSLFDIFEDF